MPRFAYKAVADSGQRTSGTLRTRDRHAALTKLRELGYHPLVLDLAESRGLMDQKLSWESFIRIRVVDLAVVTRQLAALLKAGMPIIQAIETLRRQCGNSRLTQVLEEIHEKMSRDAAPLSEALDEHPRVFDPVYRGLVRSGEEGGNLVAQLNDLARHLGQGAKLRGQVLGAFIYPAFLLILGLTAIFVLMTFVIPRFQELFESFGQELPPATKVLIALSDFLAQWWWLVLGGLVGLAVATYLSLRKAPVRQKVHHLLLHAPVLGPMYNKIEVARVARTLGALLSSGIHILEALRITAGTVRNLAVRSTFSNMIEGVSSGKSLAEMMEKSRYYPPMMVNLIRTGEETGEVSAMLGELSEIYEGEAERAVTNAVKLLEPFLIVVMGLMIAGIVVAVILPIFQSNTISG